jgi:hypothetical protein
MASTIAFSQDAICEGNFVFMIFPFLSRLGFGLNFALTPVVAKPQEACQHLSLGIDVFPS